MRKTGALFLGAFYLVLTTGMFVCAMYCTAAKLAPMPVMQMAANGHEKCCCEKSKSTDCTKKHGSFVIKENTKPGYQIRFHLPLLTLQPAGHPALPQQKIIIGCNSTLIDGHSPPGKAGKAAIIFYHSLLI